MENNKIDLNVLTERVNSLRGLRNEERRTELKSISFDLYDLFNSWGYLTVGRDCIKWVCIDLPNTTANLITLDIINFLVSEGKLKPSEQLKRYYSYENQNIYCLDGGSYEKLKRKGVCIVKHELSKERRVYLKPSTVYTLN